MSAPLYWWIAALALGVVELLTGTFWMLVLAAGAVGAAFSAHLGASLTAQLAAGAAVVLVGAVLVRRIRPLGGDRPQANRNPDVNQDIGARLSVPQWGPDGMARVTYRGASWEVELLPGERADAGRYVVREVVGSRLRLAADAAVLPPTRPTATNGEHSP